MAVSAEVKRAAAPVNFELVQGKTWDDELAFDDALGAPLDISGWTFRMDVRNKATGILLITLTKATGELVLGTTDAANDTLIFSVAAATTKGWAAGVYEYDLEYDDGTGVIEELLYGLVVVIAEVTTSG